MAVKNSLVQQPKKQTFSAYLTQDAVKNKINQIVGGKDGQRFITALVSAVSTNPALAECDHNTIFSAALLGEGLKLAPSPQLGQYYMVPFNDRKNHRTVATFVLGYKGYLQLAIRSGNYKKINVLAIKEGELKRYDPLNEEIEVVLIDDDEIREATPTIGYYAMFEYQNGFKKAMYWSKKKMMAHADRYSQAFSKDETTIKTKNGPIKKVSFADYEAGKFNPDDSWLYSSFWYKDFDGMAYKTMLRQLISKWGIMSIDMANAFERDETFSNDEGDFEYVSNVEIEPAAGSVIDVEGTVKEEEPPGDKTEPEADNKGNGAATEGFSQDEFFQQ